MEKFNKLDYGFITDVSCIDLNRKVLKSYRVWSGMVSRCYNINNKSYKTYGNNGVTICEEWKLYSNFQTWFDSNYIEGFEIDKDYSGCSLYSPSTCVFISKSDNSKEAMSRRDFTLVKGEGNPNSKPKEYYAITPIRRPDFKNVCKSQGWEFGKFKECWEGVWHYPKNGGNRFRKFTYVEGECASIEEDIDYDKKPKQYYSTHLLRKSCFKSICKRNCWNILEFKEVWKGDYYINKTNGKKIKKYLYVYIQNILR